MSGKLQLAFLPLVTLFLFSVAVFAAEKEVMPTFAKEGNAQVARGGEVQIVMEAIPDYGNSIAFEIQSAPAHGRLSGILSNSDHTAVVTYQHDGSKIVLHDEFLFRAQSPGRAKSPPTRVSITVIPPPAHLEIVPREINFGTLFPGEKARTNVIIQNIGGMMASGRIMLPVGYSAPEGSEYSLNEGDQMKMTLEFSPLEVKNYAAQADSQPFYEGASLQLKGEGKARFSVLKTDPLTCSLTNHSDQLIQLSFSGDSAWLIPPAMELPPHTSREVSFQQAEHEEATPATHYSSKIQISDGVFTQEFELPPVQGFIPLTVTAKPPTSFGMIPFGDILPLDFSIQNRSEISKSVRWIATSSSGGGMSSESSLLINGGQSKDLHYDWKPTLPGEATLKIIVKEGTKTTHELLWQASVQAIRSTSTPESSPTPEATLTDAAANQSPVPSALQAVAIASLDGLSWKEKTSWNGKKILEIRWQGKEERDSPIKIEKRVMHPRKIASKALEGTPGIPFEIESIPLSSSSSRQEGSEEIREIGNLPPGFYLIVLSKTSKEGALLAQSQIQVLIHPPVSWWSRLKIPAGLLFLCLLIALLRKLRS